MLSRLSSVLLRGRTAAAMPPPPEEPAAEEFSGSIYSIVGASSSLVKAFAHLALEPEGLTVWEEDYARAEVIPYEWLLSVRQFHPKSVQYVDRRTPSEFGCTFKKSADAARFRRGLLRKLSESCSDTLCECGVYITLDEGDAAAPAEDAENVGADTAPLPDKNTLYSLAIAQRQYSRFAMLCVPELNFFVELTREIQLQVDATVVGRFSLWGPFEERGGRTWRRVWWHFRVGTPKDVMNTIMVLNQCSGFEKQVLDDKYVELDEAPPDLVWIEEPPEEPLDRSSAGEDSDDEKEDDDSADYDEADEAQTPLSARSPAGAESLAAESIAAESPASESPAAHSAHSALAEHPAVEEHPGDEDDHAFMGLSPPNTLLSSPEPESKQSDQQVHVVTASVPRAAATKRAPGSKLLGVKRGARTVVNHVGVNRTPPAKSASLSDNEASDPENQPTNEPKSIGQRIKQRRATRKVEDEPSPEVIATGAKRVDGSSAESRAAGEESSGEEWDNDKASSIDSIEETIRATERRLKHRFMEVGDEHTFVCRSTSVMRPWDTAQTIENVEAGLSVVDNATRRAVDIHSSRFAYEDNALLPTKGILLDGEHKLMFVADQDANAVYEMDIERETVVAKFETNGPNADFIWNRVKGDTHDPTFMAGSARSIYHMDTRVGGTESARVCSKHYNSHVDFTAACSNARGGFATGSNSGIVRLYDGLQSRPGEYKIAKTQLTAHFESITGIDTLADGSWIVVTMKSCLIVYPTRLPNSVATGFERRLGASKHGGIYLQLKADDIVRYNLADVEFQPASFHPSGETIITSVGSLAIVWDFTAIKAGVFDKYLIRQFSSVIQESKATKNDTVVVAHPTDIEFVKKPERRRGE